MDSVKCFEGEQISAVKLIKDSNTKVDKATVILIDGYYDTGYDSEGNATWEHSTHKEFGTSELGLDPEKFDIYYIGFKESCSSLIEASDEVGQFISTLDEYTQINLLGKSKGGLVFGKSLETIGNIDGKLLERINLFATAAPWKGTISARPDLVREKTKKWLHYFGLRRYSL